jgi:hypothetical protein
MSDKFLTNKTVTAAAEGRMGSAVATSARNQINPQQTTIFTRVVVEEVLFDPSVIDENRAKFYEQEYKFCQHIAPKR